MLAVSLLCTIKIGFSLEDNEAEGESPTKTIAPVTIMRNGSCKLKVAHSFSGDHLVAEATHSTNCTARHR